MLEIMARLPKPKTARRIKLRALIAEHPEWNAMDLAPHLGITPQRVRQIASTEGIALAGTRRVRTAFTEVGK